MLSAFSEEKPKKGNQKSPFFGGPLLPGESTSD